MAPARVSASLDRRAARWHALGSGVEPGTTYTVVADVVRPTADELRAEVIPETASDTLRYTVTPDDLSFAVRDLAMRWTRGAENDYERVIAIQEWFTQKGGFTYDDEVPASTSDEALVEFLIESKRGFCQQFSSAMAIMLRSLGIPARLAVGFTPGTADATGDRFTVTTENAHSWVEVLFPSYGWIPFEPTPNRQNLAAYPYLDPDAVQPCTDPDGSPCEGGQGPPGAAGNGEVSAANSAALREGVRPDFDQGRLGRGGGGAIASGTANAAPDPGPFTTGNALLAATVLGAITLALVPPVRALGRRRRLRRARRAPRSLILATYDVFADRAAELGYPRRDGQTIEEYRAAVTSSGAPVDGDLARLSLLATRAAYAAREPDGQQAEEATRMSHAVVRAMRRQAGWKQRVTGPYRRR